MKKSDLIKIDDLCGDIEEIIYNNVPKEFPESLANLFDAIKEFREDVAEEIQ